MIRDVDLGVNNYMCCWFKDLDMEDFWLCVVGKDVKIKVYDIRRGKFVKMLVGYGGDISDFVIFLVCFIIIVFVLDDMIIKFWSLVKEYDKQLCICILGGEGY